MNRKWDVEMQEGKLIVLDGLDGSGKTTQAPLLVQALKKRGQAARLISFPDYENKSSTLVQMYLAGEIGGLDVVNPYAASSFYAVDRYISFETIWKKDYLAGHTIVATRYTTSNAAHQMSKLPRAQWDAYLAWLEEYEYEKLGLPRPHQVIYLDVEPDISRKLISGRYQGDESRRDLHEADFAYLQACREAALYAASCLGWNVIDCCRKGAMLPIADLAAGIAETLL